MHGCGFFNSPILSKIPLCLSLQESLPIFPLYKNKYSNGGHPEVKDMLLRGMGREKKFG
jgi:hypothetical protein